uniref:Mitochondrial pyruvate carrier 1 n=1 Tax=Molossus molossus TaxID=27622 RepID=A0A7J8GQW9_MOLMO|nr:mitochondrial pyruvate carrier 1 [Molossus molossus]
MAGALVRKAADYVRSKDFRDYLMSSPLLLLPDLHEIRLQGAAPQLAPVRLPRDQRGGPAGAGRTPHPAQDEKEGFSITREREELVLGGHCWLLSHRPVIVIEWNGPV